MAAVCTAKCRGVEDALKQYGKMFGEAKTYETFERTDREQIKLAMQPSEPQVKGQSQKLRIGELSGTQISVNVFPELKQELGLMDEQPMMMPKQSLSGKPIMPKPNFGFRPNARQAQQAQEVDEEEELCLCAWCKLPVGQVAYDDPKADIFMHGECIAQKILKEMMEEDEMRIQKENAEKHEKRIEFDIGWKSEYIPYNLDAVEKMKCNPAPKGMSCLVFDEVRNTIRLAATMEPGAAINLEYLSLALEVRRRTGTEPYFSLDPVNNDDSMQMKVWEPQWIRGTSLGEVMFQADYILKELSLGEYEQPVAGMRNCFELCADGWAGKNWSGREWFVVNKAEVYLSDDSVLVPCVQMGVQAREQQKGKSGIEDVPVTRKDHPLARYAEQFTENFDLIAERKGAIYQLREVAKASILAKFLLDSKVELESSWFQLAQEDATGSSVVEIPKLSTMRGHSEIQVQGGEIVGAEGGIGVGMHSLFGGVQFGVDRFRVAPPTRIGSIGIPSMARPAAPMAAAPKMAAKARAPLTMPRDAGVARIVGTKTISRPTAPLMKPQIAVTPQGVDLDLGRFDLYMQDCIGEFQTDDTESVIGSAFLKNMKEECTAFTGAQKLLLKSVFNPALCDRYDEGDMFIPPVTSQHYVESLRKLVMKEDYLRHQRKTHFCSDEFVYDTPGPLFPSSWTSSFAIASGRMPVRLPEQIPRGLLQLRSEYATHSAGLAFKRILKSAVPVFDKKAEDGTRFRIYRIGSLEVRTTQDQDADEIVGAVFAMKSSLEGQQRQKPRETEKVKKVSEYIERGVDDTQKYRYFVVIETEKGSKIMTEKLNDGNIEWVENPEHLEDRTSIAKTLRHEECTNQKITVEIAKSYPYTCKKSQSPKQYAYGAYNLACGREAKKAYLPSGFGVSNGPTQIPLMGMNMTTNQSKDGFYNKFI